MGGVTLDHDFAGSIPAPRACSGVCRLRARQGNTGGKAAASPDWQRDAVGVPVAGQHRTGVPAPAGNGVGAGRRWDSGSPASAWRAVARHPSQQGSATPPGSGNRLHPARIPAPGPEQLATPPGRVAQWSRAAALKAAGFHRPVGSNPTPAAQGHQSIWLLEPI